MNTEQPKFAEFLGEDEDLNIRMRLGQSEYQQRGKEIYRVAKSGREYLVTEEEHAGKPWIRDNFKRERAYQNRVFAARKLSELYSGPRYSKNQRIAYNIAKYS